MVPVALNRMVWRVLRSRQKGMRLRAYVVLMPFCLLSRGSVYTEHKIDQMYIAFVWLYVSWFHSQGIWIGSVITGDPSCILADLVWYVFAGFWRNRDISKSNITLHHSKMENKINCYTLNSAVSWTLALEETIVTHWTQQFLGHWH
jgi:hypothetical protein